MKRSPLKRRTPLKRGLSQLKRTKLKPRSKKRVREGAEYAKLKKQFLKENDRCAACHCAGHPVRKLDVHHKARRGKHYLNVETWVALCRPCHDLVEQNPDWARKQGFTLSTEQRRLLG